MSSPHSELNERFPATLLLFGRLGANDGELAEAIVRFWSGDPIRVADLRRRLRETGEARFALPAIPARELARQRLRFAARLFTAAGYAGWVVLFDEVELIGRYSVLQRGRSYAELARWVRGDEADPGLPLVAVAAMTDDFEAAVVSGKNDREVVPAKLRARGTHESDEIAARAELGMRVVDREMLLLAPPDAAELDRAYARLEGAARRGVRLGPARRGRAGTPGCDTDAPVRTGLDQRMGPGAARPGVHARNRGVGEAITAALGYREDADLEGADPEHRPAPP